MVNIFNATEEIEASASYTNIRMYHVGHATAENPQDDIDSSEDWDGWYSAADSNQLKFFSAVCFLYARYMTDQLGDPNKVFGLIESDWGGTRIEPWMSPEALEACDVPDNVDVGTPFNSNSYLYNAMIHPLLRHTIYGALWYQGESNAGWNNELYTCNFYTMIDDWRSKWADESDSDPNYPFGFVQLGNFIGEPGGVLIRWHQTGDDGVVDGSVFMAVAMDTYDEENGIHPRNKQIIGERLGIAGGNVAYGMDQNPTNGPFPAMTLSQGLLVLDYPSTPGITYSNAEISGFYACCLEYDLCDAGAAGNWLKLAKELVQFDAAQNKITVDYSGECANSGGANGIAYLWEDSPVKGMLAAPIYSNDDFRLPAAPWKIPV